MQQRSLGVTTLAFSAVMVALYCQLAAASLILAGSVFTVEGSALAAITLINGAVFLGVTVAAYAVGFGLWTHKSWSWRAAVAVFAALVATNLVLSVLASNYGSALLPTIGAVVAIVYLQRPAIRAELEGAASETPQAVSVSEPLEAAHPAR